MRSCSSRTHAVVIPRPPNSHWCLSISRPFRWQISPWTLFAKRDWPFTCQNWFRITGFSSGVVGFLPYVIPPPLPIKLLPRYLRGALSSMMIAKGSGPKRQKTTFTVLPWLLLLLLQVLKCKFSIDLVVNAKLRLPEGLKWGLPIKFTVDGNSNCAICRWICSKGKSFAIGFEEVRICQS